MESGLGRAFRKQSKGLRGFTVIEMMVIMAILGTIMAMAIPAVSSVFEVGRRGAANTLAADLRYMYRKAQLERLYIRFTFDLDKASYTIESTDEPIYLQREQADIRDGKVQETEKERNDKELCDKMAEAAKEGFGSSREDQFQWGGWGNYQAKLKCQAAKFQGMKGDEIATTERTLPYGAAFYGVFTSRQRDFATKGKAYLFIFPQGFMEPAIISLINADRRPAEGDDSAASLAPVDEADIISLITDPLTGGVKAVEGRPPKPDFEDQARSKDD